MTWEFLAIAQVPFSAIGLVFVVLAMLGSYTRLQ